MSARIQTTPTSMHPVAPLTSESSEECEEAEPVQQECESQFGHDDEEAKDNSVDGSHLEWPIRYTMTR
jgi:hypothetical protein